MGRLVIWARAAAAAAGGLLVLTPFAAALYRTHTPPSPLENRAFFHPPDFIAPDSWPPDKIPQFGRVEISPSRRAFRNIQIALSTKESGHKPDGFILSVSYPASDTQVYCYFSWSRRLSYRQKVVGAGMGSRQVRFAGRRYELMERAADATKALWASLKLTNVRFGVIRPFPESVQHAVLRAADGACNLAVNRFRPGMFRINPHNGRYSLIEISLAQDPPGGR